VVLERARLALVGVAGDVARLDLLVDELPLQAGREARAAAPAQTGRLHHLDDVVRLHAERFLQPVVPLVLQKEIEREAVRLAHVLGEYGVHSAVRSVRLQADLPFSTHK
jgi:hypothetical protein